MLNVLSSLGRRKIDRQAVQKNKERNDFEPFFQIKSNSDVIAVVRALTMRAFTALFQTLFFPNFFVKLFFCAREKRPEL